MCFQTIILLSIFSFSNYLYSFFAFVCVSLLFFSHKQTLTKLNFCPPLSIIEKQIKAILLLHGRQTHLHTLGSNFYEVRHHASITTASGAWAHKVYRQSQAECSQAICKSYWSRCKGYREFGFRLRGQGNGRKPERAGFRFKVRGRI